MADDALNRLRNRSRPSVPPRDASLVPHTPASESLDISTSRNLDSEIPKTKESHLQSAVEPETELKTKQSTLRLEQEVSDRLQEVCRANGLSREVLIEAIFEYCEAHPEVMEAAIADAQVKNERRQQIANQRRAKAMMQKFLGG